MCKAPVKLSSPTNQHPGFYRPDALPVIQPTVSEHWREYWKQYVSKITASAKPTLVTYTEKISIKLQLLNQSVSYSYTRLIINRHNAAVLVYLLLTQQNDKWLSSSKSYNNATSESLESQLHMLKLKSKLIHTSNRLKTVTKCSLSLAVLC